MELIEKMQHHLLTNSSDAFPDQMLAQPGSKLIEFDSASLFGRFEEFKIDDTTQLQTELAHSRREIEHLNSQLKQLKSELGEAHQIFDEINGHPIAGPIVKVRQKLLDMIQKFRGDSPRPETN